MAVASNIHWWTDQHMILTDALGVARAGELAARALDEESDRDAFQAMFRVLDEKLRLLGPLFGAAHHEWHELKFGGANA